MTISSSQARDVLRLLLVILVVDDEASPDELAAVQAAVRALDGCIGRTNVTRAIETLGTLAAVDLAVDHTELVRSSLMAGLDAVIAQALASGTDLQLKPHIHSSGTSPPLPVP